MLYPFLEGGGGFLTSLPFATSLFGSLGENYSLPPPPSTASLGIEIKGLIWLYGLRASIQTQKVDLKNALLIRFTP